MVALGLCFVSRAKETDLFYALAALFVVVSCVCAVIWYGHPGPMEGLSLRMPMASIDVFAVPARMLDILRLIIPWM